MDLRVLGEVAESSIDVVGYAQMRGKRLNLLVGDEDLECADDLCQRDGLVGLPVSCSLYVVDEDDEILVSALVVDLDLWCFTASHDC